MANTLNLVVAVDQRGATAAIGQFNRSLGSIEEYAAKASRGTSNQLQSVEQTAVRLSATMRQSFAGLGALIGGAAFTGVAKSVFNIAAGFERARIGIEALLLNGDRAEKLFSKIQQLALKSPFEFSALLEGAQRLVAFNFEAEKIPATLDAVSAAVGALGGDRGKVADLITALGQIRNATKLTGEELRQLRNIGVENIALEGLAKAYGKTVEQIKQAQEEGLIPGLKAADIIIRSLGERFGQFNDRISNTASVAVSNFRDALEKLADDAARNYLPAVTKALNELRPQLEDFAKFIRENPGTIEGFAKAVGLLGAAFATAKIATWITGIGEALTGLAIAAAANPFTLVAAALVPVTIEIYRQQRAWGELQNTKVTDDNIRALVRDGKSVEELEKLGFAADRVKQAFSGKFLEGNKAFTFDSDAGPKIRVIMAGEKEAAQQREQFAENRKKQAQEIATAEQRAHSLLVQARRAEFTGLADIIAEYGVYREELGKSRKANLDLGEAVLIRLRTEATKQLKTNSANAISNIEEQSRAVIDFRNRQFQDERTFRAESDQLAMESFERQLGAESDAIRAAKELRLAELEALDSRTVAQKINLENRRLKIERDYIEQSLALQFQAIERRRDRELLEMSALRNQAPALAAAAEERMTEIRERAIRERETLEEQSVRDIAVLQASSAARATQIQISEQQRAFEQFRSSFESLIDQMFSRARSVADVGRALLTALILTPLKQAASSLAAQIATGQSAAAGKGGVASGGLGGLLGGLFGRFGGGAASFGAAGAPGGTPGFAGPVASSIGTGGPVPSGAVRGGFGQLAAVGAAQRAGLLEFLGIGGSIQTGAGTATTFGAASLAQKLGSIGRSNAALAAGGLLAFDGLRRGGALGLAETTGGGALIGFKFGGPLGAAIGAGAGAAAGIIRLFVKGAQEKIVEKVRNLYGISISKEFARDPLLGIIKQQFGGNIDVGIRSPQVRDLIELYGMSTGAGNGPLSDRVRPLSFRDNGRGGLQEIPGFFNGQPRLTVGAASSSAPVVIQSVQLVVGGDSAAAFMQGQIAPVVADSPDAVAAALQTANKLSIGRRDLAAAQLGMVTA